MKLREQYQTKTDPSNVIHSEKCPGIEVFLYDFQGSPTAIAFTGRRQKPTFNTLYRSEFERESTVREWVEKQEEAYLKKKAATQFEMADYLQVGDFVYNSWGYDQTNIDWYKVVKATNRTIKIVRVKSNIVEYCGQSMGGTSLPLNEVDEDEAPLTLRASSLDHCREFPVFSIQYGSLKKGDGSPKSFTCTG